MSRVKNSKSKKSKSTKAKSTAGGQKAKPKTNNASIRKSSRRNSYKTATYVRKVENIRDERKRITKESKAKHRKAPTHRQSPIDIRTNELCHDPSECKPDSLNIDCKPGDCCDLICTSSGFRVNAGRNCKTSFTAPYLKGTYQFIQFHMHWSEHGKCGSEHTIDGKSYAAEIHFVFFNTKYGSFAEAAEKDDGLAVIGVLLEQNNHNPNYEPLIETVKKAIGNEKPVAMPKGFTWEGLLPPPSKRDFVTYLGSLTTPPYLESVTWTVFLTPVSISDQQLSTLRKITPSNYRACQDVCGRTVRCSKSVSNTNIYL